MKHDRVMTMDQMVQHIHRHGELIRTLHTMNGRDTSQLPAFMSVEEFVGKHGRLFGENCALLETIEKGERKQCFTNSTEAFVRNGGELAYVEGIAAGKALGFPVHHAWLVDEDGNVYDPTWDYAPGEAMYFGIPFADDYVFATMQREGYYGILSPTGMFNRNLFDGIDGPEVFLHPWFIDDMISEIIKDGASVN